MHVFVLLPTAAKSKFEVKTAGAGSGILAVLIEGPSKVAISCREVDEGYEFSYTPFASGKYLMTIKYGNIPIAGSPYQSDITGTSASLCLVLTYMSLYFVVKSGNLFLDTYHNSYIVR